MVDWHRSFKREYNCKRVSKVKNKKPSENVVDSGGFLC